MIWLAKIVLWFFPQRRLVSDENSNIGDILCQMRLVTKRQIQHAILERDREEDVRIGRVLVRLKYISESDLIEALSLQNKLRNGGAVEAMCIINDRAIRIAISHRLSVPIPDDAMT